jgi:hypothetical protein
MQTNIHEENAKNPYQPIFFACLRETDIKLFLDNVISPEGSILNRDRILERKLN